MRHLFIVLCILVSGLYSAPVLRAQETETITWNFNDNADGWKTGDTENYYAEIKNGKLAFEHKKSTNAWSLKKYLLIDPADDYSIEVSFTQTGGGEDNYFDILFGFENWNNFCAFGITSKGKCRFYRFEDGKQLDIFKDQFSAFVKSKTQENILKITNKKNQLSFYVNGSVLKTAEAPKFTGTEIGFLLNKNMRAEIDYAKITRKKTVLQTVKDPVNGFKKENLGEKINSDASDYTPVIAPDGKTLYFTRKGYKEHAGTTENPDVWYSNRQPDGTWGKAIMMLFPVNNSGSNFPVSVTPDGNTLMVGNTYHDDGSPKGIGVSITTRQSEKWTIPKEQKIINYKNTNPFVNYFLTASGKTLLLAVENEKSYGDLDLFVCFLNSNTTWSEPKNLGNTINTSFSDFSPFLAADGKTLYFSSQGHPGYGSSDIFVSRRIDDSWTRWTTPENLGHEINNSDWNADFVIPASGEYAYFSSNDKEGFGKNDIYRIKLPPSAKPEPVQIVYGKVINKKTGLTVNAQITYSLLGATEESGKAFSTQADGYKIALPSGAFYSFNASADGFFPVSENVNLTQLTGYTEKEVNLYLVPVEKGQTIRLNNIFFDFDKWSLKKESFAELDKLVLFLKQNPSVKIEIGGHTDNKGDDHYNKDLSQKRAKTVKDYLISKGVETTRVSHEGYGETKPEQSNDTEDGRQYNRRVEFRIIEK